MNVQELLNTNPNVCVSIGLPELKEFVMYIINEVTASKLSKKEAEVFLTPDQVAKRLHVSSNTLWRWGRLNYLKPQRVGRRLYYRQSDVEKLLNGITTHTDEEKSSGHSIMPQSNSMRRGGAAL